MPSSLKNTVYGDLVTFLTKISEKCGFSRKFPGVTFPPFFQSLFCSHIPVKLFANSLGHLKMGLQTDFRFEVQKQFFDETKMLFCRAIFLGENPSCSLYALKTAISAPVVQILRKNAKNEHHSARKCIKVIE